MSEERCVRQMTRDIKVLTEKIEQLELEARHDRKLVNYYKEFTKKLIGLMNDRHGDFQDDSVQNMQ